jgi:DnaJ-class molecular chaperone
MVTESYKVKDCADCDGQGELYGNLDESWECPKCEGEGVEYEVSE